MFLYEPFSHTIIIVSSQQDSKLRDAKSITGNCNKVHCRSLVLVALFAIEQNSIFGCIKLFS